MDCGEYLKTDGTFSDWMVTHTTNYKIDYWVAHNANVEINLIHEYTPYTSNYMAGDNQLAWGPWIDTLHVYKTLYPTFNDFSLQNLSKEFLVLNEIYHLADRLCVRTGKKFHQSMFDCVVTYMLLIRLIKTVNLNLFLGKGIG